MEKTFLEDRLKSKAKDRLNREWREMVEFLSKNQILKKIIFTLEDKKEIRLVTDTDLDALFKYNEDHSSIFLNSNIKIILLELLSAYEKEETDKVLKGLENINYLFQNHETN
jgi:hypothetical protein